LGNGSNEVIEFLGHAFLNLHDNVITSQYAFIVYKLIATSFGARTIEAPSRIIPGPRCDAGCDYAENAAHFYPQSNNPTGTVISQRKIDSFMSHVPENIVVVFDEAYFDSSMIRPRRFSTFATAGTLSSSVPFRKFTDSPVCGRIRRRAARLDRSAPKDAANHLTLTALLTPVHSRL